jgi:hypothetical protein
MPKLRDMIQGQPKQKFVKELYVGDAALQRYAPSDWVWISLDIQQTTEVVWKKLYFLPI